MSDSAKAPKAPDAQKRRWLIRGACLAVYVVLIVFLFMDGKGHTLLLDNKEAADGKYPALDGATVIVDGVGEGSEFYAGDRDKAMVKGQTHTVSIDLGEGKKVVKTIRVPHGEDMVLVSLPILASEDKDAPPAVTPFHPLDVVAPPSAEGVGNVNEFTAPGGPEGAPAEAPTAASATPGAPTPPAAKAP